MSGPFKMKSAAHGGPMRRNFGISSPIARKPGDKHVPPSNREIEDPSLKGDFEANKAIARARDINFNETNAALVKSGKEAISREEYDETLDKK